MDAIKLLVIDDNQDNLITLRALIKESFTQVEVITAQSGKEGIASARKQNPDLILLDIVMPEMDGFEVCRYIKSDEDMRDIPVVFITALKGDKESRIKALEAGGDAFLAKPVDQTELIAQIRAMVKVKLANAEMRDEQERLSKLVEEQTAELKKIHTATLNLLEDLQQENERRRLSEEALRESEEKFRTIAEQLTDLIALTDEKGVILYASPASDQLFGIAPKIMQGTHFTHFLDESALPKANQAFREIAGNLKKNITIELLMKRADGMRFTGELKAITYTIGSEPGTLVTVRDVTERKKAEESLQESETKFRTLFETANDAIFLMDDDIFTDCNPRALEMFGCKKAQIIGRSPHKFSPEFQPDGSRSDKSAAEKIAAGLSGNKQSFEWKHKRLDGTLFDSEVSLNIFRMNNQTYLQAIVRDITDRKLAEQELRDREELLRDVGKVAHIGGWEFDVISGQGSWTDEVARIHDLEPGNNTDRDLGLGFFKNESRKKIESAVHDAINHGKPYNLELELISAKGTHKWVQTIGRPVLENGKVVKVRGSMQDISERKKAETDLRESEERFKALHNASFGGIAIHDEGKIIACNQGLVHLTGYDMDELVGMNGLLLITESCRELVTKNILAGYEKPYEAKCLRKDNTEIPIRIESRNIPYKGKMVRVKEFRDISEEKRNEQIRSIQYVIAKAILNAESFEILLLTIRAELSQVMDATNFIVATYDAENDTLKKVVFEDEKDKYSEWSAKNTFSGYVAKSGKKLLFTKETEAEFARKQKIQLTGSPAECWLGVPIVAANKPAGVIVLQSYADPYAYDSGSVALLELVAHEIGLFLERKNMLTDLVEAKNQAEAGDRLKTAFMNNISHEIRTPLNGILGFGRMLAQSNVSEPERIAYLDILEKSSARLISTITDYMDISLIASGNLKTYPEPCLVVDILKESFEKLKTGGAGKSLATELQLHNTPEKLQMNTDRELVTKALMHLINNSIKFTPSGKIILGSKCHRDTIEFYVKDTGIGVSDEAKERIFQNFGQEEVSPTREYEGSGLGLSIATGIVKMLNGEIRMKTKKDVGSVFYISLPLETDETIGQLDEQESENLIPEIRKPLVLIAEDEESNAMYLKVILEKAFCEVIYVANGKEALEQCRQQPEICLVFMDMKMPVMNGVEATKQIKALRSDLPVIAITAHALTGDEHYFRSAGCDDYLAKPVLREMIIAKLKKYNVTTGNY